MVALDLWISEERMTVILLVWRGYVCVSTAHAEDIVTVRLNVINSQLFIPFFPKITYYGYPAKCMEAPARKSTRRKAFKKPHMSLTDCLHSRAILVRGQGQSDRLSCRITFIVMYFIVTQTDFLYSKIKNCIRLYGSHRSTRIDINLYKERPFSHGRTSFSWNKTSISATRCGLSTAVARRAVCGTGLTGALRL